MPFDLLGLPQDVRNHIIGYVAQLPAADIARALRVNRELNQHPGATSAMVHAAGQRADSEHTA